MKMNASLPGLPLGALAGALATAFGPAYAQDADVLEQLSKPQSTMELGAGALNSNNLRFGRDSGLSEEGAYGLIGTDMNRRDEASGTWTRLRGRDLGLDSRELRFEHERQGNWRYFIDFSQNATQRP